MDHTASAKNHVITYRYIFQDNHICACPNIISNLHFSNAELSFWNRKWFRCVMVIVVKNLHSFTQNAIFANVHFSKTRNRSTRDVSIFSDNQFSVWFHGDEIWLVDGYIFRNIKFWSRRDVQKIVGSYFETWMNLTSGSKKNTSLMLINTSLDEAFEFGEYEA